MSNHRILTDKVFPGVLYSEFIQIKRLQPRKRLQPEILYLDNLYPDSH